MAIAKIVPEKDWEVLREYLIGSDVVLIKESIAKKFSITSNEMVLEDYEFGGDPDLKVDMVSSTNHYALDYIKDLDQEKE